jgi:hypothetical protein
LDFDDKYRFLFETFTGNEIYRHYHFIYADILNVIRALGCEETVIINRESLKMAVLDCYTDLVRLKEFHYIACIFGCSCDNAKGALIEVACLRKFPECM